MSPIAFGFSHLRGVDCHLSGPEAFADTADCHSAGDFARGVPSHAIGNHQQSVKAPKGLFPSER